MPYKFTYFDVRARGETIRMLFALAKQDYEDVRVDSEQFKALKPKTIFGQIPMLEVDGNSFCQSHAIERFLARRFNLYGKDEYEQTKSDMLCDCGEDFIKPLLKMFGASDEQKEKVKKAFAEETIPALLPKFEQMVSPGGFFLGSKIMWPDVAVFNCLTWPPALGVPMDLTPYPKLTTLVAKVESDPQIAAWIKKRPNNSM